MLSAPDFAEKQLVFVNATTGMEDTICFQNENISITKANGTKNQISCHKTFALFVIGDCSITTNLMRKCEEYGVSIFFLNNRYRCYLSALAKAEGNYLLRAKQYSAKNELEIAKNLVKNKVLNHQSLLKEAGYIEAFKAINDEEFFGKITSMETLRGCEGAMAREFFQTYFRDFGWRRRSPRSREDVPNFLLDIGYNMLFNFVDAQLSLYGFDTYKGVYHQLFFQRKSLVCDVMEPLRCIIDKQLRKSYNLKQINEDDFIFVNGEYSLPWKNSEKYVRIFAEAIMKQKMEIFHFIQSYYYFVLNDEKEFPIFNMK